MTVQDREPAQPTSRVPATPRSVPHLIPADRVAKLKTGLAGRDAARPGPTRNLKAT
jgi:hypothetical protein